MLLNYLKLDNKYVRILRKKTETAEEWDQLYPLSN